MNAAWSIAWVWGILGLVAIWTAVFLVCRTIIGSRTRGTERNRHAGVEHQLTGDDLTADEVHPHLNAELEHGPRTNDGEGHA